MGLVGRSLVWLFARLDDLQASRGPASVFLAAYTALGNHHTSCVDALALQQAGVDADMMRDVDVGHGVKSAAVMVGDAVNALSALQVLYNARKRALKANPEVCLYQWYRGVPISFGPIEEK